MQLDDDFARWRDDPMTRRVFDALGKAAEAQQRAFLDASWSGGMARADDLEKLLLETRTRADAYRALEELTVERLCEWLGIEAE